MSQAVEPACDMNQPNSAVTRGQYDARPPVTYPASDHHHRPSTMLPDYTAWWQEAGVREWLVYSTAQWVRLEPATSRPPVRRPTSTAIKPHSAHDQSEVGKWLCRPWTVRVSWQKLQQFRCEATGSKCCHEAPPRETKARQSHLKTTSQHIQFRISQGWKKGWKK